MKRHHQPHDAIRLENLRRTLPAELPLMVSPREFAQLIAMSPKTVYEWHRRGLLASVAIKQGKHIRLLTRPALELFFTSTLGGKP